MESKIISTKITIYTPEELSEGVVVLINKAKEAAQKAYAPYSKFHVGAAVQLQNGEIFAASNQENEVYNLGCCAERVALFNASSQCPNSPIKRILLLTIDQVDKDYIISPCGACRQVLLEYERKFHSPIEVMMIAGNGNLVLADSAEALLPLAFSL